MALRVALRTALWLLLGGWVGSWGLFGLVVAGIGLGALAALLDRGMLRIALPLVLAAACAYSQFGVSAEIAEIRDGAFGPTGSVGGASRWNALHQLSIGIYLAVSAGALALVGLHAASDTPPEGARDPS
jgi:hypothetical protein